MLVLNNEWGKKKKAYLPYLQCIASFATSNSPIEVGLQVIINGIYTEMSTLYLWCYYFLAESSN